MISLIEIGKRVDIINHWLLAVLSNVIEQFIISHNIVCIMNKLIDVIIEGKIVKLDHRIRTFNEEEIPKEAEKTLYNLFNRTGTCKDIDTPRNIL